MWFILFTIALNILKPVCIYLEFMFYYSVNLNLDHYEVVSFSFAISLVLKFTLTNNNTAPLASLFWRRQWHPTPVLLPGKSHGWRSLVGCSPWGHEESDTTERLHFHFHALEKEMATHSSVLAWRIPGTGEPGGLPSMGSHSWTRLK